MSIAPSPIVSKLFASRQFPRSDASLSSLTGKRQYGNDSTAAAGARFGQAAYAPVFIAVVAGDVVPATAPRHCRGTRRLPR
jgi:hypothetical protein